MSRELAFGSAALMAADAGAPSKAMHEKLIMQGLKEVTMHEVGPHARPAAQLQGQHASARWTT